MAEKKKRKRVLTRDLALEYIWNNNPAGIQAHYGKEKDWTDKIKKVSGQREAVLDWLANYQHESIAKWGREDPIAIAEELGLDRSGYDEVEGEPVEEDEPEAKPGWFEAIDEYFEGYKARNGGRTPSRDEMIAAFKQETGLSQAVAERWYDEGMAYSRSRGKRAPKELQQKWLEDWGEEPTLDRDKWDYQKGEGEKDRRERERLARERQTQRITKELPDDWHQGVNDFYKEFEAKNGRKPTAEELKAEFKDQTGLGDDAANDWYDRGISAVKRTGKAASREDQERWLQKYLEGAPTFEREQAEKKAAFEREKFNAEMLKDLAKAGPRNVFDYMRMRNQVPAGALGEMEGLFGGPAFGTVKPVETYLDAWDAMKKGAGEGAPQPGQPAGGKAEDPPTGIDPKLNENPPALKEGEMPKDSIWPQPKGTTGKNQFEDDEDVGINPPAGQAPQQFAPQPNQRDMWGLPQQAPSLPSPPPQGAPSYYGPNGQPMYGPPPANLQGGQPPPQADPQSPQAQSWRLMQQGASAYQAQPTGGLSRPVWSGGPPVPAPGGPPSYESPPVTVPVYNPGPPTQGGYPPPGPPTPGGYPPKKITPPGPLPIFPPGYEGPPGYGGPPTPSAMQPAYKTPPAPQYQAQRWDPYAQMNQALQGAPQAGTPEFDQWARQNPMQPGAVNAYAYANMPKSQRDMITNWWEQSAGETGAQDYWQMIQAGVPRGRTATAQRWGR